MISSTVFALPILVTILISVVVAILVLVAVLIPVVTVLPAALCLRLIGVLIRVVVGILIRRSTLIVVRSVVALLASVSRGSPLRVSPLRPIVSRCVAISWIASALGAITVTSTGVTHHQTAYLVRIFHADQVAIRRKAVVDIAMVTIAEVVILILDGRRHFWQSPVADIVHLLGNFTRRTQGPVALFYTVTDVVIVLTASTTIARTALAFASIAVVISMPTAISTLCTTRIVSATTASLPSPACAFAIARLSLACTLRICPGGGIRIV